MRSIVLGAAFATGISVFSLSATAASISGVPIGPHVSLIENAQMSGYCRRLRRACEFKDERGQVGEGNCRRYRIECGRGYRDRGRW
jgi:hypothetical protein